LSLLLRSLMMTRTQQADLPMSVNMLHEKLAGIREVLNIFPTGRKKTATQSVITRMDEIQQHLFDIFEMKKYLTAS
ncbi:hypothetical protein KKI24_21555, partial [bacterium]|nr:hypothetical protein [bacterium]